MADAITIKALQDASLDAKSLEEVVNGNEVKQVTTRKGETYPSVKKAITQMFQNGGLPAKPFPTLAKMQTDGANLADGEYAQVTDDTVNNGLYVKEAGSWVKSTYDPVVAAAKNTLEAIEKVEGDEVILGEQPIVNTMPLWGAKEWSVNSIENAAASYVVDVQPRDVLYIKASSQVASTIIFVGDTIPEVDKHVIYNLPDYHRIDKGASRLVVAPAYAKKALISKHFRGGDMTPEQVVIKSSEAVKKGDVFLTEAIGVSGVSVDSNAVATIQNEVLNIVSVLADYKELTLEEGRPTYVRYTLAFSKDDVVSLYNDDYRSASIPLKKGQVLTFDYYPIAGVNAWIWDTQDRDEYPNELNCYPILSHQVVSDEPKSFRYVAHKDMEIRICNYVQGTIRGGGYIINGIEILYGWYAKCTPKRVADSDKYAWSISTFEIGMFLRKGESLKFEKVPRGSSALSVFNPDTYELEVFYAITADNPNDFGRGFEWTAEKDCIVFASIPDVSSPLYAKIFNGRNKTYSFKRAITPPEEAIKKDYFYIPDVLQMPEELSTVFATAMNFILKTEIIEGVEYILISQDLGKTYNQIPNILGNISQYHFFSDGTIMLCSPHKVYWTDDYQTLNEAVVYDHDGSVFDMPDENHFFSMQNSDKFMHVDGQEMFVWGDYIESGIARIWYTTDNGRTIKCAAKFGTTVMDGEVRDVRHVHRINYRKKDESFYITTGDWGANGEECMILRANYDVQNDEWTWKFYNFGHDFKYGAVFFDDVFAYLIADFTITALQDQVGIYRVPIEHLGDRDKYQLLYAPGADVLQGGAFSRYLEDTNGNKVILPDGRGGGKIWIARQGFDFKTVPQSNTAWLAYVIGPNYNGDVYLYTVPKYQGISDDMLKISHGSYNITQILRDNGITNFMVGYPTTSEYMSVTEQPQ